MRAVVIHDGKLVVEERPDPAPGDTELSVRVHAAGINSADLLQRKGLYPPPPGFPPDIPGMEFAGTVEAVGRQVRSFSAGDRVMAVVGGGAQASMALVDETHTLRVPESVPFAAAGGFPEVYSTAFDALFDQCGVEMGDRVLVTGAAGGVGTAGVQLARAAGASVVASVRNHAHHDEVRALGADEVVDPADVGHHGPYDVVLELVGAASFPSAFGALAAGGRISVIGVASGAGVDLNLLTLMQKRASVRGSTLRARSTVDKAIVAAGVTARVLPLLADGRIRVPVAATYPLADVEAAYQRFADGAKLGKVVLLA